MALPLVAAAGFAGLQALAIGQQNKEVGRAFVNNRNRIVDSLDTQINQLQEQQESINSDIALEMTANRYEGLKRTATTTNDIVESNIVGNTATRLYDSEILKTTLSHNQLVKKAEDNAISFGVEMENATARANQAIYNAGAQAKSQYTSGFKAITQIAGAAMQGYMMGSGFAGSEASAGAGASASAGQAGGFTTSSGQFVGV